RADVEYDATPPAGKPMPPSGIDVSPRPLWVNVRFAVLRPVDPAANRTCTVQVPPTAIVAPVQLSDTRGRKAPGFVPVTVTDETFNGRVPVFVSVTVRGWTSAPMATGPNPSTAGESDAAPAAGAVYRAS